MFIKKSSLNAFELYDQLFSLPHEEWATFIHDNHSNFSSTLSLFLKNMLKHQNTMNQFLFILHITDFISDREKEDYFIKLTNYISKLVSSSKKSGNEINFSKLESTCEVLNINSVFFNFICNRGEQANHIINNNWKHTSTTFFYYALYREVFNNEYKQQVEKRLLTIDSSVKEKVKFKSNMVSQMISRGIYKLRGEFTVGLPLFSHSTQDIMEVIPIKNLRNITFLNKLRNRISYIIESNFQNLTKSIIEIMGDDMDNFELDGGILSNVSLNFKVSSLIKNEETFRTQSELLFSNLDKILTIYESYLSDVDILVQELTNNLERMSANEFMKWHSLDKQKRYALNSYSKKISKSDKFIKDNKINLHYQVKNMLYPIRKEYTTNY